MSVRAFSSRRIGSGRASIRATIAPLAIGLSAVAACQGLSPTPSDDGGVAPPPSTSSHRETDDGECFGFSGCGSEQFVETSAVPPPPARAPFMHDGCAATLRDRFDPACGGGDLHGTTSTLTDAQISDLVAYLETLRPPRADELGRAVPPRRELAPGTHREA